jgi:DnaK suppressor protein
VRRALDRERDAALAQHGSLLTEFEAIVSGAVDGNGDDEHDPEGPTVAFERSRVAALAARTAERIEAVEVARARLDRGTYQACAACGSAIGDDRLAARPTTTVCIGCASGTIGSLG